ncbi:MAG TPA: serine--tRNA ligase [Thermoleophilaceae bacterium]|nr:serine--tRNA ligase [Thermoleophilaceae bacterium]
MLDLKLLRREPDQVRAALARRGAAEAVDELLQRDARRREVLPQLEGLRAKRNEASDAIGQAKRSGEDASDAIAQMRQVGSQIKALETELAEVESALDAKLATLPNLPDPTAADEDDVVKEWGEPRIGGRDHVDLLGWRLDMETGARVAGSRFVYMKGELVLLEFALVRWALELVGRKGFVPVTPPVLVREEALFGTGFLPDTEQQIYSVPDDNLYLAGTSEVPLSYLHAGQILEEPQLPLRYAGFSTCFRREAGAAGKDTRGMFRVHQFDKVEMFTFVRPEDSAAEHDRLLAIEEEIFQALDVPYRVVNIGVAELGNSAAKKYDVEAWLPGDAGGRYREVTSCSNTTDYQARRLDARYRPADGKGTEHLHTLNGTAVAVGRTIISIVENHQQEDGSIAIPEVLHAYGAPPVIPPAAG